MHLRVGDAPIEQHVVYQDQAARPHQLQHELIVFPVLALICICDAVNTVR